MEHDYYKIINDNTKLPVRIEIIDKPEETDKDEYEIFKSKIISIPPNILTISTRGRGNFEYYNSIYKPVAQELFNNKKCILTLYGSSGHGKTSSMIYNDIDDSTIQKKKRPGDMKYIISNFIDILDEEITIEYKTFEIGSKLLQYTGTNTQKIDNYFYRSMELNNSSVELSGTSKDIIEGNNSKYNTFAQDILLKLSKRTTKGTINNPDSSRTHLIVLTINNEYNLIILDLAGREQTFNINNIDKNIQLIYKETTVIPNENIQELKRVGDYTQRSRW